MECGMSVVSQSISHCLTYLARNQSHGNAKFLEKIALNLCVNFSLYIMAECMHDYPKRNQIAKVTQQQHEKLVSSLPQEVGIPKFFSHFSCLRFSYWHSFLDCFGGEPKEQEKFQIMKQRMLDKSLLFTSNNEHDKLSSMSTDDNYPCIGMLVCT